MCRKTPTRLCAHFLWSSSWAKPGAASCTVCLCLWAVVKVNASTVGQLIWDELAVTSPTSFAPLFALNYPSPQSNACTHTDAYPLIIRKVQSPDLSEPGLIVPFINYTCSLHFAKSDKVWPSCVLVCVNRSSTLLQFTIKSMHADVECYYVSCDYTGYEDSFTNQHWLKQCVWRHC